MDYGGPWYEQVVITKHDCFIKMIHSEFNELYEDQFIKSLSSNIHDEFNKIILSNIDDEYNKYNGLGSIRGYYTFTHRPLCSKIKHKLNILCFKYKCALNRLNKHNHIFLQWLYKPNGPIFKKIASKTYVGQLRATTTTF